MKHGVVDCRYMWVVYAVVRSGVGDGEEVVLCGWFMQGRDLL